ncbi:transposable element Tc3 transposase [Trichonephila clavipes]|nr:transposable element Tc3 transposase [Trichonephila clavipes]
MSKTVTSRKTDCLVRFMGWWNPSSKTMKATTLQSMELWFQQDGATCHTARVTIDSLKDTFGDRLISRFGPVNWPPRSCDLTPIDYFLWGYVKSLVYADKPQTLDHLEDNIRRVIADIRPQMLEKVIENWTSRLDYILASRGSHMPEIIFKLCGKIVVTRFIGLPDHRTYHGLLLGSHEEFGIETPFPSVEDLIARMSIAAGRIGHLPGIIQNVRNSMQRRCQNY